MFSEENPKRLAQIALVTLLIVGCVSVLLPILGAVLFAFVIWMCTWPVYVAKVLPRLGGRNTLGAALMLMLLVLLLLVPTIFLAGSLASGADRLIAFVKPYLDAGLPTAPPDWLSGLPVFGGDLERLWHQVAGDREALNALLRQAAGPTRQFLLTLGTIAANGLLQLLLVLFVVFFLYRDGAALTRALHIAVSKLGGEFGEGMLDKAQGTVLGVMLGIVGTAAGQGAVAMLGFLIAGLPAAILMGFATFFLSMVPIGPPLVWGGAAAWLYSQGETGWAIFMVLYGLFVISSIDNFVKPVLMAKGSGLSILLIALGVLGGVMVFGFIGLFLGPVLLALGQMLFERWIREDAA